MVMLTLQNSLVIKSKRVLCGVLYTCYLHHCLLSYADHYDVLSNVIHFQYRLVQTPITSEGECHAIQIIKFAILCK